MLKVRSISKRFGGAVALADVSFEASEREILAIIGENGAGKSTLMKIIGGVFQPDGGHIELDGQIAAFGSPRQAVESGVRVIYQELSGLENLDIASNLFLGIEPKSFGIANRKQMIQRSSEILARLGMELSPETKVGALSIAERQMIEIARALTSPLKLLILDEPTSSLTVRETERLFDIMRELKSDGVTILLITHRLDEIPQIADRVVGLRDGRYVGELSREEISKPAMIQLMVGRHFTRPARAPHPAGDVVLELRHFRTSRFPNAAIDLTLRAGEIVTLAGLIGAGRTEIARAIFGIDPHWGEVLLGGKPLRIRRPSDAIEAGIALIPEDRKQEGIHTEFTLTQNITLPALTRLGRFRNPRREAAFAKSGIEELKVKASGPGTLASELSGGNQQKAIFARWLKLNPKVLIIDEPTRGIDVGSKGEIYDRLRQIAGDGCAILMISSDMEEVLSLSDRVAVMANGKVVEVLDQADLSEERIMAAATRSSTGLSGQGAA